MAFLYQLSVGFTERLLYINLIMELNRTSSIINDGVKFEKETLEYLRSVLGNYIYIPQNNELIKLRPYYPDAIVSKKSNLNKKLNLNPNKDTIIEILYTRSTVYLNRIIRLRLNSNKYDKWNFLIIYKTQRNDEDNINRNISDGVYITNIEALKNKLGKENHKNNSDRENLYNIGILSKAKDIIQFGNYSLFLGAGVSIDAGLPNWSDLMKKIIKEVYSKNKEKTLTDLDYDDIEKQCFNSSIIVGQFLKEYNEKDISKDIIQKCLYENYNSLHETNASELISSIISIIQKNMPQSIVTYNYDDLIENFLENSQINKYETITGGKIMTEKTLPIYHVHGYVPNPVKKLNNEDVVLTEESYHKIYQEPFHWSNIIQLQALNHNTCFFIGLSMSDPNLRRLLDISMKNCTSEESDNTAPQPRHYVFLRRDNLKRNCPTCAKNTKNEEIQEKIMNRLGLNVIWFDKFEDLPKKLNELIQNNSVIENNHKKQNCLLRLLK